ncbi:MAG: zinc ribbon domain-containing protein [Phycisphaerae bacterium]|nr:zinc ribbon domain-containing protein [Phycisphaerae bacterium]
MTNALGNPLGHSLAPRWHELIPKALRALGVAALAYAILILALAGATIYFGSTAWAALSIIAFLVFAVRTVALLATARVSARALVPILLLLGGATLLASTGTIEFGVFGAAARVLHAIVGLGSILLIVAGAALAGRGFRDLLAPFAIDLTRLARLGRRLRALTYVSLAIGLVVPFIPLWLSHLTPRDCATWTAVAGAALFAVPAGLSFHVLNEVWALIAVTGTMTTPYCPRCGYPRPAGTRCSECGHEPGGKGKGRG